MSHNVRKKEHCKDSNALEQIGSSSSSKQIISKRDCRLNNKPATEYINL